MRSRKRTHPAGSFDMSCFWSLSPASISKTETLGSSVSCWRGEFVSLYARKERWGKRKRTLEARTQPAVPPVSCKGCQYRSRREGTRTYRRKSQSQTPSPCSHSRCSPLRLANPASPASSRGLRRWRHWRRLKGRRYLCWAQGDAGRGRRGRRGSSTRRRRRTWLEGDGGGRGGSLSVVECREGTSGRVRDETR
jgi:hypothetical protein